MFCYCLLGGDTVVPKGLYARLCHAFLVVFFFVAASRMKLYILMSMCCIKNISCDVCSVSKCYVIILHVATVYKFLVMLL